MWVEEQFNKYSYSWGIYTGSMQSMKQLKNPIYKYKNQFHA